MGLGTDRVRASFNPGGKTIVDEIKLATAQLIDLCQEGKDANDDDPEEVRLWALAQTSYEEAAMWAVKAATTPKD